MFIKRFFTVVLSSIVLLTSVCNYTYSFSWFGGGDKKTTTEETEIAKDTVQINNSGVTTIDEAYKTEINMLNYLIVTTQAIKTNKDRAMLDKTYDIVYEDLNLEAVDTETQKYVKRLANTITKLKISDEKRKRIKYMWEQERAAAIRSAIPNPIGLFSAIRSANLADIALSGVYMIGDSITGYKYAINTANMNYLKQGWDISDDELIDIDALNSDLWDYKNNMRRNKEIPNDLILNKSLIEDFVKNQNLDNVDRRITFFETNAKDYTGYPTYWLVLANCYYMKATENIDDNGNGANKDYYKKCFDAVKKYENNTARIFRKDTEFADIIPLAIASAEQVQGSNEYKNTLVHYSDLLEKNIRNDNHELQYFLSQMYVKLYELTKSREWLDKAYKRVYANTSNLVREQNNANEEYFNEYKDIPTPDTATKEEKNEIKQMNKENKEARKYELPPVNQHLLLNCQLLFELANEKRITDEEKRTIDSILHDKTNWLFYTEPLDNLFWYFPPSEYKVPDYSYSIICEGDKFKMDSLLVCDSTDIKMEYSDEKGTKVYDHWEYEVDRKENVVTIIPKILDEEKMELKKIDYKINKNTKAKITVYPIVSDNCEPVTAKFKNNKGWVLNHWDRE
ncbi:MAG: hypothetical protein J6M39_09000 [Lachnospiraceae bacterium]|nr:hypothetical protein [Lachnospiraceae bacterium]